MLKCFTCLVFLILAIAAVSAWSTPSSIAGYVAPHLLVGTEAYGSTFAWEHRMDKGFTVRTLQVWYTTTGKDAVMQGMRVLFTDGTWSMTRGWEKDKFATITLDNGELITQVLLWGTVPPGAGTSNRLARIEIQTSGGKSLVAGRDQIGASYSPFIIDIGSGVFAGFFGSFGQQVDGGGFLFYKPIKSINVYNLQYLNPPLAGDTWGFSPRAIDQVVFRPTAYGTNWRFGGSITRTESHSWSSQTTESYGVKVTISADLFSIIKFETEFSWTKEVVTQSSSSFSTEITLEWDLSGTAIANSTGHFAPFMCSASVYTGKLDMNWVGRIRFEFVDNSSPLDASLKGSYRNVVYSRVDTQCAVISR